MDRSKKARNVVGGKPLLFKHLECDYAFVLKSFPLTCEGFADLPTSKLVAISNKFSELVQQGLWLCKNDTWKQGRVLKQDI